MRHIIPEDWWPFGREIVTESGNSFGIPLNHPQIIRMFLDNPDNFPHPSERQIFPQNYCDWSSIPLIFHITPKLTQFVFWELLIQSVRVLRYSCFLFIESVNRKFSLFTPCCTMMLKNTNYDFSSFT